MLKVLASQYLIKLKIKLQFPKSLIITICITIIFCSSYLYLDMKRDDEIYCNELVGIVTDIKTYSNYQSIEIKSKLVLISTNRKYNIKLGDKIKVVGKIKEEKSKSLFYEYNDLYYLKSRGLRYRFIADKIYFLENSKNIFYNIKQNIFSYIDTFSNKKYIKAFIFADQTNFDEETSNSITSLGISHLFAVSGMHISYFLTIFNLFKKKKDGKVLFFFETCFLIFYSFLTGFTPSILRSGGTFILSFMIKDYKKIDCIILVACILLIYQPYFLFHLGFILSFIISLFLVLFKDWIYKYGYFKKLFLTSFIAFLTSLPIILAVNFEFNILTIIFNMFYIPFVSFLLFPLSILVVIFPFLDGILSFFIMIFENSLHMFKYLNIIVTFKRLPIIIYFIYEIFIILTLYKLMNRKYIYLFILIFILIIHYSLPFISNKYYITMIDVNQGDSTLIEYPYGKTVLIDTGGLFLQKGNMVKNRIIPLLKSRGLSKIDILILTHGDFDHIGDTNELINSFKVNKVIFNCGDFSDLEKDIIRILEKKRIPYYSCVNELNVNRNKLYFLNNKDYGNENDNSNVIYTKIKNYKLLFMSDAGVKVESDLIDKYNLQEIDILKIGHHGSKTSSSNKFINNVNPKHSIISVGKNNRYGHPNKEVLDSLYASKIYRTDIDGSVMFEIKKARLLIKTSDSRKE